MASPDPRAEPLLNPFPFASETYFRLAFLMLVAAAVALSAGMLVMFAFAPDYAPAEACLAALKERHLADLDGVLHMDAATLKTVIAGLGGCIESATGGSMLRMPLLFVGALASGAVLSAALHPRFVSRRAGLQAPPAAVLAIVGPRLDALLPELGLRRRPDLFWMPLEAQPRAFVFGSDRRPRLALSYGAVAGGLADPDALDTLIAHELAHVANRDVTAALVTHSVLASMLCVVVPLYLACTWFEPQGSETFGEFANEVLRLSAAFLVMYLARNAVLRARERYADLRAGLVPRIRAGLESMFRRLPEPPRWRRPFSVHPTPARRSRGLGSTEDLFRAPFASALAFGFALSLATIVAIVVSNLMLVDRIIASLTEGRLERLALLLFAPVSLLAVCFTSAVAPIAWRASFAEIMLDRPRAGAFRPALGAAIGATLGLFASTFGGGIIQGRLDSPDPRLLGLRLSITGIVLVLFFALFYLHFAWLRRTAFAWSGPLVRRAWGGRAALPIALVAGIPIALFAPPVFLAALTWFTVAAGPLAGGMTGEILLMPGMLAIGGILVHPAAPLALALASLLPLGAAALRGGAVADWPTLAGRIEETRGRVPLRPLRAALIGVAAGTILGFAILGGPVGTILFSRNPDSVTVTAVIAGLIGTAGFVASIATPALRLEHGLLSTGVAAAAFAAVMSAKSGRLAFDSAWWMMFTSFPFGLAAASLGAGLRGAAGMILRARSRARRREGPVPAAGAGAASADDGAVGLGGAAAAR